MMTRLRPTHTYLPFKFYPVYFFPIRYNRTSQLGVKKKMDQGRKQSQGGSCKVMPLQVLTIKSLQNKALAQLFKSWIALSTG